MADTLMAPIDKPVILPAAGQAPAEPPKEPAAPAAPPEKGSFLDKLSKLNKPADKPNPDAPVLDDDLPSEVKSDKGKDGWAKIKSRATEAEKRAADFEAKFNTETATLKEQLAAKEKEIVPHSTQQRLRVFVRSTPHSRAS